MWIMWTDGINGIVQNILKVEKTLHLREKVEDSR